VISSELHVEIRDQDIAVTMPGTSLRVVYRKPHGSQLAQGSTIFKVSRRGAEFMAKALKLANDKARELGWIV